jgi:hypothetical protein
MPLRQRIDLLFAQQRATWPALAQSEAALGQLPTKTLTGDGAKVIVQLNPARRHSTHANTDARAIAARACFLCPENMPPEERGVAFEDLVLLPNPYPVLPLHATIASREHRPQRLAGSIGTLLRLAREIGPELAVFYNGARCGASAPDHFHFQCGQADGVPVLKELLGGVCAVRSSFGRRMVAIAGADVEQVRDELESTIDRLGDGGWGVAEPPPQAPSRGSDADEPLFNLVAHFHGGGYRVVVFPRVYHRPACYFAEGPERIAVSPAVLEMCGVMVVTEAADFERMDAATVRAIFEEVCLAQGR